MLADGAAGLTGRSGIETHHRDAPEIMAMHHRLGNHELTVAQC